MLSVSALLSAGFIAGFPRIKAKALHCFFDLLPTAVM
jgi:hypothetical protein